MTTSTARRRPRSWRSTTTRPAPGLIGVPFDTYIKLDAPLEGRAHRILSFARAVRAPSTGGIDLLEAHIAPNAHPVVVPDPKAKPTAKPDPALVEYARHRGRVYVFTSTFNEDWNDWPSLLNYLPFWHEFLKCSVDNPDRHTLRVGESIEEFYPAGHAGSTVGLSKPDGSSTDIVLENEQEAGVARYKDTTISGLYRLRLTGSHDRVFAVNVAEYVPGAANESDLRRIAPNEFKAVDAGKAADSVQVVSDPMDVKPTDESGAVLTTAAPKQHGPMLARRAVTVALLVLIGELLIAWRFGPSRTAGSGSAKPTGGWLLRPVGTAAALLPLAIAAFVLVTVIHAEHTDNPFGFLPHDVRSTIESAAGVTAAAPGEGTKWHFEHDSAFFRNAVTDQRTVAVLGLVCVALTIGVYRLERARRAGSVGYSCPCSSARPRSYSRCSSSSNSKNSHSLARACPRSSS